MQPRSRSSSVDVGRPLQQLMDMDDDFTFPTAAAAPPPEGDVGGLPFPAAGRLLAGATATSPPLWPFSSSSPGTARQTSSTTAQTAGQASSPSARIDGQVVVAQLHAGAAEGWERERADAASKEERMDLLWEDFNAKELLRSVRSSAAAATHRRGASADRHSSSLSSDAESEETETSASASGRRYGCAPTMLRASSRAGGPGQQFYDSSRRRRTGRTTGWTLLLRLFRRLFAVDKTPPSRSRRPGIYVP